MRINKTRNKRGGLNYAREIERNPSRLRATDVGNPSRARAESAVVKYPAENDCGLIARRNARYACIGIDKRATRRLSRCRAIMWPGNVINEDLAFRFFDRAICNVKIRLGRRKGGGGGMGNVINRHFVSALSRKRATRVRTDAGNA